MGLFSSLFGSPGKGDRPRLGYDIPDGWSSETLGDPEGELLLAPEEEAGWQANIFVEGREDPEGRDLESALDDLIPNLSACKEEFQLSAKNILRNGHGTRIGVIEFFHAASGIPIVEWELVIPHSGPTVFFHR